MTTRWPNDISPREAAKLDAHIAQHVYRSGERNRDRVRLVSRRVDPTIEKDEPVSSDWVQGVRVQQMPRREARPITRTGWQTLALWVGSAAFVLWLGYLLGRVLRWLP